MTVVTKSSTAALGLVLVSGQEYFYILLHSVYIIKTKPYFTGAATFNILDKWQKHPGDENDPFLPVHHSLKELPFFKKSDLLINDSNKIGERIIRAEKKVFPSRVVSCGHHENLRLFKKTSFVSIIKRDIDSKATLENLNSLSSLTEICIQTALVDSWNIM